MRPAMEAVLTMTPPPRRRIAGTAASVPAMTAHRLTAMVLSHLSRGASGKRGQPAFMPALLCRMSTPPNVYSVKATIRSIPSQRVTSVYTNAAWPPASSRSRTVSRPPASSTSATATAAPASARAMAVARPMPEPPPVTRATLPARSFTPALLALGACACGCPQREPGRVHVLHRVHRCVDHRRLPAGGRPLKRGPQVGGAVHVLSVTAHGDRHLVVPDGRVLAAEPVGLPPPHPTLGALFHPVRSVHGHDGHNGQPVAGGGLQFLHVEPEGAVPAHAADRPLRRSQLGAYGEWQPRPQMPGVGCPQHGALLPHEEVVCRPDAGVAPVEGHDRTRREEVVQNGEYLARDHGPPLCVRDTAVHLVAPLLVDRPHRRHLLVELPPRPALSYGVEQLSEYRLGVADERQLHGPVKPDVRGVCVDLYHLLPRGVCPDRRPAPEVQLAEPRTHGQHHVRHVLDHR